MAKQRKKRQKTYSGSDAKVEAPIIHRYSAIERSRLGQWWHDHGKVARRIALYGGGAIVTIWLIVESIRLAVR